MIPVSDDFRGFTGQSDGLCMHCGQGMAAHGGAPYWRCSEVPVDQQRGLYRKYEVNRLNDATGKHRECTYFVLDEVHDKFAGPALLAYADACEAEFPRLAADLRARWGAEPGERERSIWVEANEEKGQLPDSDIWVLAANHEGEYVVVQLEFTDDSEGQGEPYWSDGVRDFEFSEYPYWMAIPKPPGTP